MSLIKSVRTLTAAIRYKAVAADRKLKQERKQHVFKAIRTVLFVWLDAYPDDFDEPPNYPCLTSLKSFAAQHMQSSDVERCVQRCLRRYIGQDEELRKPIVGTRDVIGHFDP